MQRLLACLALAGFTGPVAACINDVELPSHEREFRSQYQTPQPPPAPAAEPHSPGSPTLLGAGVLLLAGAVGVAIVGRRARG